MLKIFVGTHEIILCVLCYKGFNSIAPKVVFDFSPIIFCYLMMQFLSALLNWLSSRNNKG